MILFCLNLMIMIAATLRYDNWTEHTSPHLPRATYCNAIAHDPYNNTIWLLGGNDHSTLGYPQQLVSFDYINNKFTDFGETYLPRFVMGRNQNYAQIGSILYTVDFYESYINIFNVETTSFTSNYSSLPSYIYGEYCCIVNIRNKYIAVLGFNSNSSIEILNMQTQIWFDSVPLMQVDRESSSCTYVNDKIYVVGGEAVIGFDVLSSIEYLNVSTTAMMNIASQSWTLNVDSLPIPIKSSSCIAVNDDVLVIGGLTTSSVFLDTVYVIDSITASISLGGHLAEALHTSAVIVVNNIIYGFAGWTYYGKWDGWQTKALIEMLTSNPSSFPSVTALPSNAPSQNIISTTLSADSPTDKLSTTELIEMSHDDYDNDLWTGTVIYITLSLTESVSINDVVITVNHSITEYLLSRSIVYLMDTDVIAREGTPIVIIIFSILPQLENNDINMKEIEDKTKTDLDHAYDDKVVLLHVATTVYEYDNDSKEDLGDDGTHLWLIVSLIALSICVILICGCIVVWMKSLKLQKQKISYNESGKNIAMNKKVELKEMDIEQHITHKYDGEGVINEDVMNVKMDEKETAFM